MRAAPRWLPVIQAREAARQAPLVKLWEAEMGSWMDRARRDLSVYLYGDPASYVPPVKPFRLPVDTLVRRTVYGGRKGRAAARRLRLRGAS